MYDSDMKEQPIFTKEELEIICAAVCVFSAVRTDNELSLELFKKLIEKETPDMVKAFNALHDKIHSIFEDGV